MRLSEASSGTGGASLGGMYVAKSDCPLFTYNLGWDQPTLFKPLACPNDTRTALLPSHNPNDLDELTPWIYTLQKFARAVGVSRKITFNAELPEGEQFTELPYQRMRRILEQMSKTPQYAGLKAMLFEGGPGKGMAMPHLKRVGLMQGVLYMHNGKNYLNSPKVNILMVLSPSATTGLAMLLSQKGQDGKLTSPNIFDNAPTKVLHFLRSDIAAMLPPGWNILAQAAEQNYGQAGGPGGFKSHIARLVSPPTNVALPSDAFNMQTWKPWESVVRTLSAGEQIEILCSAFDPFIALKAFERSEFDQYLPDFIKNGTVTSMPEPAPQQFQQPQPYSQQWQQPQQFQQPQQQQWNQPSQQQYPQPIGYAGQVPNYQPVQTQPVGVPNYQPQQQAQPMQTPSPFNMGQVMGGNEGEVDDSQIPSLTPNMMQPAGNMQPIPTPQVVPAQGAFDPAHLAKVEAQLKELKAAKERMQAGKVS